MKNQDQSILNSNKKNSLPGIWLGIDLGTTNTTAAFYSPVKHKSKLIRFSPDLASVQENDKYGRILPSALRYENGKLKYMGKSALNKQKEVEDRTRQGLDDKDEEDGDGGVLLTSVKRIWGMDTALLKEEMNKAESFLDSCPFQTSWVNDELRILIDSKLCQENDSSHDQKLKSSIMPIEVAQLLLKAIRDEATKYFMRERKKNHSPLGWNEMEDQYQVRHCIMTVPAHFSRKQREKVIQAAKNAGFDGHISTMVESTAAAMAYGMFVSPTIKSNSGDEKIGRKILVCDIGGGTTDITIASMMPKHDHTEKGNQDPSFQVLATAGDRKLGGDDMDDALARFIETKLYRNHDETKPKSYIIPKQDWIQLRRSCRNAKEILCGDGNDNSAKEETHVRCVKSDEQILVTRKEFDESIEILVERVACLVDKALKQCQCSHNSIDEVILVGGATRTPTIRTMLQNKFKKNELCYSIDADAAVAQGAAIQCAILSGLVPKHELRNALMLDAIPHSIGVLIGTDNKSTVDKGKIENDEMYVPILESGLALPAMKCATFSLDENDQKGVTIIAVEDVDEDLPLQRIGKFNFLLHRLSHDEVQALKGDKRTIDVGFTLDEDGRFIVSIFDKNDPEDLKKKQRYQEMKHSQKEGNEGDKQLPYALGDGSKSNCKDDTKNRSDRLGAEELFLTVGCTVVFFLYIMMRLLFHQLDEEG